MKFPASSTGLSKFKKRKGAHMSVYRGSDYDKEGQQFIKMTCLFAVVVVLIMGALELWASTPVVYYSQKTEKPIMIEVRGKKETVQPNTVIPSRHTSVWVP
jgi:hypothetical protein